MAEHGAGLVVRDVAVRAVVVPLRRPLATKVGDFSRWPLLFIDVTTEQGITGRGYCRALDAEGLAWIEEPLRYDDLDGHARLAADLATPVMLGENFYGPRAMAAVMTSAGPPFPGPRCLEVRQPIA